MEEGVYTSSFYQSPYAVLFCGTRIVNRSAFSLNSTAVRSSHSNLADFFPPVRKNYPDLMDINSGVFGFINDSE